MNDQIIYLLLGIAFLTLGLYFLLKTKKLKQMGILLSAKVTEIASDSNSTSNMFYPVISFTTLEGKKITRQSDTGSNPSIYKIGQEVNIYYNSQNPEQFVIDNFLNKKLLPYGFLVLGFIFIITFSVLFFDLLK